MLLLASAKCVKLTEVADQWYRHRNKNYIEYNVKYTAHKDTPRI